ncbi:MAG: hypothetical protein HC844_09800 [Tabrizicola sp.]|nr:hypothetical protein [Tabrizicola sp.]
MFAIVTAGTSAIWWRGRKTDAGDAAAVAAFHCDAANVAGSVPDALVSHPGREGRAATCSPSRGFLHRPDMLGNWRFMRSARPAP